MYRLRKSKKVLTQGQKVYLRKKKRLSDHDQKAFYEKLKRLHLALEGKDRATADREAHGVEDFIKTKLPKSSFDHAREFVFALTFAIVVAFFVREYWFELYEVPTGSMRPTIEELDRLVVSKTTFGLHLPFQNKMVLTNPDYIKRNGIVVFSVEDMDVADADTRYFYLFPGKKRYVKRCLGKPGDTVYFYGGRLYGVDKENHLITELADEATLEKIGIATIDHIPYITVEGNVAVKKPLAHGVYSESIFSQMHIPMGKVSLASGALEGRFFNGKEWVKEDLAAIKRPHTTPQSYSELFGMGNFAPARLLTPAQVTDFYGENEATEKAPLYLELQHHANLTYPAPEMRHDEAGRLRPMLTPFTSLIPLQENHLHTLQKALFTARFHVKNTHAYRYHEGNYRPQRAAFDPLFPGVPEGTYEFENGLGYKIHFTGVRTQLPADHPLYASTPENIQKLFNLGIHFNTLFQPMEKFQPFTPQRFAYFRAGDLYVMGKPLLLKDDPTLQNFVQKEVEKQQKEERYLAFVDPGPPSSKEYIENFGLHLTGVLALGDNYAMSADSREFGFVPTNNLRGAPSFIFWPFSSRIGPLPQAYYPYLKATNILVWAILFVALILIFLYYRYRRNNFFKEN